MKKPVLLKKKTEAINPAQECIAAGHWLARGRF